MSQPFKGQEAREAAAGGHLYWAVDDRAAGAAAVPLAAAWRGFEIRRRRTPPPSRHTGLAACLNESTERIMRCVVREDDEKSAGLGTVVVTLMRLASCDMVYLADALSSPTRRFISCGQRHLRGRDSRLQPRGAGHLRGEPEDGIRRGTAVGRATRCIRAATCKTLSISHQYTRFQMVVGDQMRMILCSWEATFVEDSLHFRSVSRICLHFLFCEL